MLNWITRLWQRSVPVDLVDPVSRDPALHIVILDGTASSLQPGYETNAGLTYQLLKEQRSRVRMTLYYEPGIQWHDWRTTWDVLTGKGINRQIKRAYGALANRYKDGDRIIFIGYSRGAYAVRSLAGVIDRVGLVISEHATERRVQTAYRHYEAGASSHAASEFRERYCHASVKIDAVAVWDTVKALGVRFPGIWRFSMRKHAFHNHALGPSVRHGFHAVAKDETRVAYAPVMWLCPPDWTGRMEQVWFRGTHSDIGGQISGIAPARRLSNIPLVWLLEKLEQCGVPFPEGWKMRFPQDVTAPSVGQWRGWAKLFWYRRKRVFGQCHSERLHETIDVASKQ